MAKILIVDDEQALVKGLKLSLEQAGFQVSSAYDGNTALDLARSQEFDLIILDLMLPEMDGFEVCRELRKTHDTPIIMLTARGEPIDRILGLELGADDYVAKPFNARELIARIRAILRRTARQSQNSEQAVIKRGRLVIDQEKQKVSIDNMTLDMTAKEYELLRLLASNPGRVYTREQLLELVWGYDFYGDMRTVDVHVHRLREKLAPLGEQVICTKWGTGYYFKE